MQVFGWVLLIIAAASYFDGISMLDSTETIMQQTYVGLSLLHGTLALIGGALCFGTAAIIRRLELVVEGQAAPAEVRHGSAI